MKRISVIGHFGFGLNLLNGQTIKTKIITEELERIFGNESVKRYDTHGGLSFALRLPFVIYIMLSSSKNVIIMPGDKGLLLMMPLIAFFNIFFRRHVYYAVLLFQKNESYLLLQYLQPVRDFHLFLYQRSL